MFFFVDVHWFSVLVFDIGNKIEWACCHIKKNSIILTHSFDKSEKTVFIIVTWLLVSHAIGSQQLHRMKSTA